MYRESRLRLHVILDEFSLQIRYGLERREFKYVLKEESERLDKERGTEGGRR